MTRSAENPKSHELPAAYAQQEAEWNRAYEDAMQWRDWLTCEILIDEREQADWWKERDRDED